MIERCHERGASRLVVLGLAVVVLAIGFVAYFVLKSQISEPSNATTQQKIEAVPELNQADTTLSDADKTLEESLDTTALDKDIDALL
ncbi:hypothetical protein CSA80_00480 [Candidatus Saccharibacteria bacterium]|nr:MAG: hypothetical protein CR973_00760 [Candidatus Saccharibacteria bacterium]PID99233.1 MAG: hypothetical protein CSA80_00480 [Candidatus Saccharibacteria bacterium]